MILFNPSNLFTFNYPAFDQVTNLSVQARIYDVTTGAPSLVSSVVLSNLLSGFYSGTFQGQSGKAYLVITNVYTDGTFTTVDPSRSPAAECYKSSDAPVGYAPFNYGAFDQESNLDVEASVYDVTTGTPNFISKTALAHVFSGVYFGSFSGTENHVYEVVKFVYTSDIIPIVDSNWSAGSDVFQLFSQNGTVVTNTLRAAILTGQSTSAILKAQC